MARCLYRDGYQETSILSRGSTYPFQARIRIVEPSWEDVFWRESISDVDDRQLQVYAEVAEVVVVEIQVSRYEAYRATFSNIHYLQ